MRTTTPRQFPTLRVSDGDSLRSGHEAVPDLLDQLQPILDTEREGVLQYRAHDSIVRWQPSGRKTHLGRRAGDRGLGGHSGPRRVRRGPLLRRYFAGIPPCMPCSMRPMSTSASRVGPPSAPLTAISGTSFTLCSPSSEVSCSAV